MNYQVDIAIDAAGLNAIYGAGQSVVLARPAAAVVELVAIPSVAWIAFAPLQSNQITFTDGYLGYASTTPLALGNVIVMNSRTSSPVQPGWTYTFASGSFSSAAGTGSTFDLVNGASATMTFGLAQTATVNGTQVTAPIDAMTVLYNESVVIQPAQSLCIFLSSASANGTVVGTSSPAALTIALTGKASVEVSFNDTTNSFYLT